MREEVALSVMVDGQVHFGLYAVEPEMMTVWISSVGSRTCWLEGRDPGKVARLLLREVTCPIFAASRRTSTRRSSRAARRATRMKGPNSPGEIHACSSAFMPLGSVLSSSPI